jgi:hypothetical protein
MGGPFAGAEDAVEAARSFRKMSQHVASIKPLFLSEEEAMALLDLCLMSSAESDPIKERSLLKLTDLIRRYITEENSARCALAQDSEAEVEEMRPAVQRARDEAPLTLLSLEGPRRRRSLPSLAY